MTKKQLEIAGTERREIPEVEEAAEDLRALRGERMALQVRESAAKQALLERMSSHGVRVHRYVDSEGVERRVELVEKRNAKISKIKASDDEDAVESGGEGGGGDVEVH